MKTRILIPAVAAAALMASAAQAASGYTINTFHLYNGPGHSYARMETVPENARVHIFGCTPRFDWCDVSFGSARGWIDAHGLETYYAGRRMAVIDVGPRIGLPVITSYDAPIRGDERYSDDFDRD